MVVVGDWEGGASRLEDVERGLVVEAAQEGVAVAESPPRAEEVEAGGLVAPDAPAGDVSPEFSHVAAAGASLLPLGFRETYCSGHVTRKRSLRSSAVRRLKW